MNLESYFEELTDPKDLLYTLRKRAWDQFQAVGLPKRKSEAFQYVPLENLSFPPLSSLREERRLQLPAPLICLPLSQAMRSYGVFLQNRLSRTLKEEKDPFALLNGALQSGGIFIYVPPKTVLQAPIVLEEILLKEELTLPRIHVYLGKGASVTIRHTVEGTGFCNLVVDAVLDEGARLSFFEEPALEEGARYLLALRASLKRDSFFHYMNGNRGAKLSRTNLYIELLEENSETLLQGLSHLSETAHHHIYSHVEHKAPHTRSRQHFKCVAEGESVFSFEGKIKVGPEALKTEAYQLCNTLLLSERARVNAKPNLEVFADDVKASHGATIGELDAEVLFYLRSRGLSEAEAREWLVRGFCQEMLDVLR